MVDDVGRRQRKREQIRNELTTIATRLFAERGYDPVTVDEIAANADISTRTFYRYFAAKEDVLLGDPEDEINAFIMLLRQRPVGEPIVDSIRSVVRDLAAQFETNLEEQQARARLIQSTSSLDRAVAVRRAYYENTLFAEVRTRVPADEPGELYARLVASCAISAMNAASAAWIAGGGKGSLIPIVDRALEHLTVGLARSRPLRHN